VRISLKEAVELFRDWKERPILVKVTMALRERVGVFDWYICKVSPSGRLMFLDPNNGKREAVNLQGATWTLTSSTDPRLGESVAARLARGMVTLSEIR